MKCQHEGCAKPAVRFIRLVYKTKRQVILNASYKHRWIADCGNHRIHRKYLSTINFANEADWVAAQVELLL